MLLHQVFPKDLIETLSIDIRKTGMWNPEYIATARRETQGCSFVFCREYLFCFLVL